MAVTPVTPVVAVAAGAVVSARVLEVVDGRRHPARADVAHNLLIRRLLVVHVDQFPLRSEMKETLSKCSK